MKTQLTSHTKLKTADRDTVIGSALSRELAKSKPTENCPSSEEMAAFLDGCGTVENRDQLMGHFAVCDRCREMYSLAHDLNSALEPIQQSRRGWYRAGGSMAAVAFVVLVVKLTIQDPILPPQQMAQMPVQQQIVAQAPITISNPPETTTHKEQIQNIAFNATLAAQQLAHAASAYSLAEAIGSPASSSYGFAGSGTPQAIALRVGNEMFELELWLAAGEKEQAGLAGERLLPLLSGLGGDVATTALLTDLLRELEIASIDDVSRMLEAMQKTPQGGFIRLGSWIAAAKLALNTGIDPYFGGNPPQFFLKELGTQLSPLAKKNLKKMNKNNVGNDSIEVLRLLDKLVASI